MTDNARIPAPFLTVEYPPPRSLEAAQWLLRVVLSERQALVGVRQGWTYGIRFQHATTPQTLLPYTCTAEAIYAQIAHAQGDATVPPGRCLDAIRLLQMALTAYGGEEA